MVRTVCRSAFPPFLHGGEHAFRYPGSRLLAARGETGPVIEVDDAYRAVGIYYAVAAIDFHIEYVGSLLAHVAQFLLIEMKPAALAVDGLMSIFAVSLVEGIEPIEERLSAHSVELYEITHKMAVDHGTLYAAVEILMEHFLRLFRMAAIADVLLVHGMEVSAFYPA